jgi:hypothetical protein
MAAALAKLGRLTEARAAAARELQLHPTFRYSRVNARCSKMRTRRQLRRSAGSNRRQQAVVGLRLGFGTGGMPV